MVKLDYLIAALDCSDLQQAKDISKSLQPYVGMFKVGLELYTSLSKRENLSEQLGSDIFLDLKLHDIPNTVYKAFLNSASQGVKFISVHCLGGPKMLNAALEASDKTSTDVLAVTILTSMDENDLHHIGMNASISEQVVKLVEMSFNEGVRNFVCSPKEISLLRSIYGDSIKLVTPGIRFAADTNHDQKRIATPETALKDGADWIVMGRSLFNGNLQNSIYQLKKCR